MNKKLFFTDKESEKTFIEFFKKKNLRYRKKERDDKYYPIVFETSDRGFKYIMKSGLFEEVLPF